MKKRNVNNNSSFRKNIYYLNSHGTKLALHSWIPIRTKAVLFYISGIQSHAGWLLETGPALASQKIALFSLDRRGSGMSGGLPGDIPSASILLDDYLCALKIVKQKFRSQPLTLLGQSLGGSILAALVSHPRFDVKYDAAVFCTSGLGRQHQLLSTADYEKTRKNHSTELKPINLSDADMTNDLKFLRFMQKDKLKLTHITRRAQASLLDIEDLYWNKVNIFKNMSAVFVRPTIDPIVDISTALSVFMRLADDKGLVLELPIMKHYLWFTKARHMLLRWLSNYILTAGYKNK